MKNEETTKIVPRNKFSLTKWKYSLVIALTLIGGYILLVGILLYPIITAPVNTQINEQRKVALDAIKSITTVFGPWIAALVAFYFAGKQLETVSDQLGEAQRTITASVKPGSNRMLEGKFVKDVMVNYDTKKHKIPVCANEKLTKENIQKIEDHIENQKGIKCFVVFRDEKEKEIEGIITPRDVKEILKKSKEEEGKPDDEKELTSKKLEDLTTDMVRLKKVELTQSLVEIQPSLTNFKVLPAFEGDQIKGFVYKDDVFKLMTSIS